MAYELKWEEAGVYGRFYGELSTEDLILFNSQLVGDSRFDHITYQIIDFLEVEKTNGGINDITEIATVNKIASTWNNGLRIMVVTDSEYLQSLTKVFEELVKDTEWKVEVYNTMNDALKAKSEVYK